MKRAISIKRFKLLVFLISTLIVFTGKSQPKQTEYYKMEYSSWFAFVPGNNVVQPFYISAKPITNREYILYLVWTSRVYVDYPTVLFDALPGIKEFYQPFNSTLLFSDSTYLSEYFEKAEPFVRDYMFNLKYLDYPVIGVSWAQANNFCRWYSNRYNEFSVVKLNHLAFDKHPINSDNFTSETFVFRQYTGQVAKVKNFDEYISGNVFYYLDYNMRPAFHVATKNEILTAKVDKKVMSEFKSYYKKPDFLTPYWDTYFLFDNNILMIKSENQDCSWCKPVKLIENNSVVINLPNKTAEWFLDSYQAEPRSNVIDILCNYSFKKRNYDEIKQRDVLAVRKDSLGNLPYLIVGETSSVDIVESDSPVYWKNINGSTIYIYDNNIETVVNGKGDIFTTFRVAVNAVKKNRRK